MIRLLDSETLKLNQFHEGSYPPYVVLSHTWAEDEVDFEDISNGTAVQRSGYRKLLGFATLAKQDGYQYIWMDTCCIDKRSSAELTESINSMFRWYNQASRCYVYLADTKITGDHGIWDVTSSRWFKRGWTLQELLAPPSVYFYDSSWELIGTRQELIEPIHQITGIPSEALKDDGAPLSSFSIEARLSWASGRMTTRVEDRAYCMFGILDVSLPVLYGEGGKAMERLMREVKQGPKGGEDVQGEAETRLRASDGSSPPARKRKASDDDQDASKRNKKDHDGYGSDPEELHPDSEAESLLQGSFRLLTLEPGRIPQIISGHLQAHELTAPPAYHALSYVWGQEPRVHPTLVNGQSHMIQPNVFHALQRFRLSSGPFAIWVDTLCINQEDAMERSVQVGQMDRIYGSASAVLIWLGEEDALSKIALDFLPTIISDQFRWTSRWWEEPAFAAVMSLVDRPWFRRGWVIQEAVFSRNSIIRCGDQEIHFDTFTTAMKTIRDRLNDVVLHPSQVLYHFNSCAAMKLIDTVTGCRKQRPDGSSRLTMSLGELVFRNTHSDTTDPRDAIYTLLNLANDISPSAISDRTVIRPDYIRPVLDTFVMFIEHCCRRNGQLDIICRPWAPGSRSSVFSLSTNAHMFAQLQTYPSWLATKDMLAFGQSSDRIKHRIAAEPLAEKAARYYAHYGTEPHFSFGKTTDGLCDGTLSAGGLILGSVFMRSARMAHAIVTQECIDILKSDPGKDVVWRTLCADRGENGERAPLFYQDAFQSTLILSSDTRPDGSIVRFSGIDPQELLETEIPDDVESFVKILQRTVWDRRTIKIRCGSYYLVGLSCHNCRLGDLVCVLYGCSVPVVLRPVDGHYQLIGDAYIHGMMDGEAISSGGASKYAEELFVIK